MSKATPFLIFSDQLEAAIAFYTATFPDSNPERVKAVMDAMMTMVKLDVAALERAYDEAS
jgi:predicted 3-demethylubiquinone-9 3-methyltransferase (glyoxalase superfamily)